MIATEIRMLSVMGKKYGRSHKVYLNTPTPADATKWLLSQFPEARKYLMDAEGKGIVFAVFRGRGKYRENIGKDQLHEPAGDCITFAPLFAGSKGAGVLQTIIGVVLIVIGGLTSVTGVGTGLMVMGIGMVAGGVAQMLSPQPRVAKAADSADNQASYLFNGPVNTTAQGQCVPVLYGGPMEIGSAVISAGIEAVDYSSRPSNVTLGTLHGNTKKTPYDDLDDEVPA